jgi:hypothetical protein
MAQNLDQKEVKALAITENVLTRVELRSAYDGLFNIAILNQIDNNLPVCQSVSKLLEPLNVKYTKLFQDIVSHNLESLILNYGCLQEEVVEALKVVITEKTREWGVIHNFLPDQENEVFPSKDKSSSFIKGSLLILTNAYQEKNTEWGLGTEILILENYTECPEVIPEIQNGITMTGITRYFLNKEANPDNYRLGVINQLAFTASHERYSLRPASPDEIDRFVEIFYQKKQIETLFKILYSF